VFAKNVFVSPNPSSGVAPLEVQLRCVVNRSTSEPSEYIIDFGDGSDIETFKSNEYSHTFTHTYTGGFFRPICKVRKTGVGGISDSNPSRVIVAKWKFETGDDIDCSPAIDEDGIVYIGSDDGNLYAVDPHLGEELWHFTTGGEIRASPTVAPDGTIYFGSLDNNLYAITSKGSLKWSLLFNGYLFSSPAISSDGSTVFIGSSDKNIYAITRSGTIKWKYETGGKIISAPSIGYDGIDDVVYVGSLDNHLYALAASTGLLKWKFKTNAEIYGSPAISTSGQIYVGECRTGDAKDYDFKFYSINVDGSKLWEVRGGTGFYSSPAIGTDNLIYVGGWDGLIHAIHINGNRLFANATSPLADVNSSPAVGSNMVAYVGCKNGNFYAVQNPNIEEEKREDWVFKTGDDILQSSPAIDDNGTIYFGSRDNNLYAINPGNMTLAESPWPMFQGDSMHTGAAKNIDIPTIISSFPAKEENNVSIDTVQIKVNFAPGVEASQVDIDSFKLIKQTNDGDIEVDGIVYFSNSRYNNTAYIVTAVFKRLNEDEPMEYNTVYSASISYVDNPPNEEEENTTEVGNGTNLDYDKQFRWSFTTEIEPKETSSSDGGSIDCFIKAISSTLWE
jgi:outer membrane protein assembly factor BamB